MESLFDSLVACSSRESGNRQTDTDTQTKNHNLHACERRVVTFPESVRGRRKLSGKEVEQLEPRT